ncbi:MAG TPA: hypothetical protein VJJ23_01120 [Candidatus Nanoarchaeia archaeon]|nr:hypothetical protein [Candidatus Nanoarchaeia archaeon]
MKKRLSQLDREIIYIDYTKGIVVPNKFTPGYNQDQPYYAFVHRDQSKESILALTIEPITRKTLITTDQQHPYNPNFRHFRRNEEYKYKKRKVILNEQNIDSVLWLSEQISKADRNLNEIIAECNRKRVEYKLKGSLSTYVKISLEDQILNKTLTQDISK